MSWVAVERAIRVARQRGLPADLPRWTAGRDRIYRADHGARLAPRRRAFVQHYDSDVLDASLLLMPLCKFIAPTDPRWISTLDAITAELVSDSLVYRYDVDALARRARRRGGDLLAVLVLVGGGARPSRAARRGALAFEKMLTYATTSACTRGDRADRRAARQLPAGVHAPGADQRRLQPRPPARVNDMHMPRRTSQTLVVFARVGDLARR
jgi:hypothetical protein